MDLKRKKQLLEEYKNRKPEMGVISLRCLATGEAFLGISKDTRADLNSLRCKLSTSWHPNKRLQELWNQYGESGFELSVVQVLKYEDPGADHTEELEEMRDKYLVTDSGARRIWR
jgi:hypothetical protein